MDELTRHRKRRLKELVDAPPYRGSQVALAAALEKTESYISQLANPEKYPFGELTARRIAQALRLDERYFEHGYQTEDESMLIPMLSVEVGAGSGRVVSSEEEIGGLAFRSDFLRECGIYAPEDGVVLTVKGDSMGQTVPDGAVVLVNKKNREPMNNKIFVFVDDQGPVVKRVLHSSSRWIARSDNEDKTKYPDFPFKDGNVLIGKAVWMGVKL